MLRPDISLCASAVRPHLWKDFYKSTLDNNLKVEIIFVGDVLPDFELPYNFKFHHSPVKPTQCWEAAIREATGRYISITADDAEYTPGSLDNMVKFMDTRFRSNIVGSFQTIENGNLITNDHMYKDKRMAPFFVFNRDYYTYIGGADRRFIGGMWENDVIMRVHEDGGEVQVCENAFVSVDHLKKHNATSRSCEWHFQYSFPLLEKLWENPDKRLDVVQEIDDKDILKFSQGEKGYW